MWNDNAFDVTDYLRAAGGLPSIGDAAATFNYLNEPAVNQTMAYTGASRVSRLGPLDIHSLLRGVSNREVIGRRMGRYAAGHVLSLQGSRHSLVADQPNFSNLATGTRTSAIIGL
jgi:hypothetical protein